jgi:hypothetical protein
VYLGVLAPWWLILFAVCSLLFARVNHLESKAPRGLCYLLFVISYLDCLLNEAFCGLALAAKNSVATTAFLFTAHAAFD